VQTSWNGWQGKPKYLEKTCPSAALYTTNATRSDLGLNPGSRSGKPVTIRLSYGTAGRQLQKAYNVENKYIFTLHSTRGLLFQIVFYLDFKSKTVIFIKKFI
jgi:hypothetical protein